MQVHIRKEHHDGRKIRTKTTAFSDLVTRATAPSSVAPEADSRDPSVAEVLPEQPFSPHHQSTESSSQRPSQAGRPSEPSIQSAPSSDAAMTRNLGADTDIDANMNADDVDDDADDDDDDADNNCDSADEADNDKAHHDEVERPFDENANEKPLNEDDIVLAKASLRIVELLYLTTQPPTHLLICTNPTCEHALVPSSVVSHPKKNHKIILTKSDKERLFRIVEEKKFALGSQDVTPPTAPCKPIDGLKIQAGNVCDLCSYCCSGARGMSTHFTQTHKGLGSTVKDNYKSVQMQAFFRQRPKYFAVMPILQGRNNDDLFVVYLQQCAPEVDSLKSFNLPLDSNEIPLLLKTTQWHEHLKPYLGNEATVNELLDIMKLPNTKSPTGQAWMGSSLRLTIQGYMKDAGKKADSSALGIRCLLMECPRFVAVAHLGLDAHNLILGVLKAETTG